MNSERTGNPQLQEGHTRLANELLEALMRLPLLDRKSRIIFCLLRFSYGCGNKLAMLSSSDISLMTSIAKPNVITSLNEMSRVKIISWDKKNNLIQLNKHYRDWNPGKQPEWFDVSKNLGSVLKKNLDLVDTPNAGGIESIALESIAIDSIPPEQKNLSAGIPVDTTTGIHGDTGHETGWYRINTGGGIDSIPANPPEATTGAPPAAPKESLKKETKLPPPTHPNREVPLPSPTPDPSQVIDQGQGSRLSEAGTGKDVSKGKGVIADKKRILKTSFIQGNTIDQAFSLFGELEPALRGFIEEARKARGRGISENLVLGVLFTFKSLYNQDKELLGLALGKVMSKEDFDYKKKNLTGLVEWYFKNPETLRKGIKSGAHKNDPSGDNRKATKETPKSRDPDPFADIATKDIPYGDPRLDNEDDPYEDISTRDIPL